jgi:2-polyprenyl-6-methoxyphenol hydroxylase-like FAD-dependent oxidoreductase
MDPNLRVIIIGGGIGGLTTALQLQKDGFKNISILEASSLKSILGVGINLQPSAVLVLRNLGLLPALEATGIKTASQNYYNVQGQKVMSEARGEAAGYLVPQFSIHRGMLHDILLKAVKERLGEECLNTECTFESYTSISTPDGHIRAYYRKKGDPRPEHEVPPMIEGDVLIAADGINSSIRALMYRDEGPSKFSGCMLWRATSMLEKPFLGGKDLIIAGRA